MLIVALVLAVIGLAALVTAIVTGNAVVAWVCIGASALGVLLLVVDAVRERQQRRAGAAAAAGFATEETDLIDSAEVTEFVTYGGDDEPAPEQPAPDKPESEQPESEQQAEIDAEAEDGADAEADADAGDGADADADLAGEIAEEDHPDEVIHDEPEYDTYSDDEQEFPAAAEEAALHTVEDSEPDTAADDER